MGRDASEFMEPEISSTRIKCEGLRVARSWAVMVTHISLPEAKQLSATSGQAGKSAEKLMLMMCS